MLSSHYNTNAMTFDGTEEGPLNAKANMNDYSFNNNSHINLLDHPFNQTNKT